MIMEPHQRRRRKSNGGNTVLYTQTLNQNSFVSSRRRSNSGIRYRECLRNHAVSICLNAYDGCGEFMAAGEEGSFEALKCAACDCHRNFHRKEVDGDTQFSSPSSRRSAMAQPMAVALGGSGGTQSSMNVFHSNASAIQHPPPYVTSKKRFRTKFSEEQKGRMMDFAEKIGWRMNKKDEEEVDKFCGDVGVRRKVFKDWMHNNKKTKKHQQLQKD